MSSNRRLVIHVGPHRTATTAIQNLLYAIRETLRASGYVYPEIGRYLTGHHAFSRFGEYHGVLERNIEALNALDRQSDVKPHVVLSSENFSDLSEEQILTMSKELEFSDVKVVFYLRNFITALYSRWKANIIIGSDNELPKYIVDFLTGNVSEYNYNGLNTHVMLERYAKAFGDECIFVYLYDEIMASVGDIPRHFLSEVLALDMLPDGVKQTGSVNASHDVATLEVLRAMRVNERRRPRKVMKSEIVAELTKEVRERQEAYVRTLNLNYEIKRLQEIEQNIAENWRHRIQTSPPGPDILFRMRSRDLEYIDPAIWLYEPDLAARLRDIALPPKAQGD